MKATIQGAAMSKSTMVELVEELRLLPPTPGMARIIEEAVAGEFHDYKNLKYPCGKVALASLLVVEGLVDLTKRVMDGEFDEEADEDDKVELRKFLPKSVWESLGVDQRAGEQDIF